MEPIQCTDQLLDQLSREGDAEADPVAVRYLEEQQREPARLMGDLVTLYHLPPQQRANSLAHYLDAATPLPDWADKEQLAAGCRFFAQWEPELGLGLLCFSLPAGYAAASFAQVLHLTALLESDAERRVFESARMVEYVTPPGGLEPGGPGYRTTRRVRLMHAAVRQLILRDERFVHRSSGRADEAFWSPEWGMPISQEQLLGGVLAFGWSMLGVLGTLGAKYDRDDADGYLHLWSVVAYLLGVRPDLLPLDRRCAELLDPLFRRRNFAPSTAGHAMTGALVAVLDRMGPDIVLRGLPVSMMRLLLGEDVARIAGVPPADCNLRQLVRLTFRPLMHRIVNAELHGEKPTFSAPSHLAGVTVGLPDDLVIDLSDPERKTAPSQTSAELPG